MLWSSNVSMGIALLRNLFCIGAFKNVVHGKFPIIDQGCRKILCGAHLPVSSCTCYCKQ